MAARTVDVTIRGRNEAGKAFRDTERDIDGFTRGVRRVLNPLQLLKGILVGLGIASVGALFRKATTAALEHERGLGRNVETLNRLGDAWNYVLVQLGRAILGLDSTGAFADQATNALARFGDWIDQNKAPLQEFIELLVKGANALSLMARWAAAGGGITGLAAALGRQAADRAVTAATSTGFQKFVRERAEIREREEAERERKQREAQAKREAEAARKRLEESLKQHDVGYLRAQVGQLGTGEQPLAPITAAAPELNLGEQMTEGTLAVNELRDAIDISAESIVNFADTWADATQEMISGSLSLGEAILKAGRRAVGGVLAAKGRETLLDAAKAAIDGFTNPIQFLRAARLFAIGTAQMAAGQLLAGGGGGGGGGGLGGGAFSAQQQEATEQRGEGTIIVEGGLLDMSDPRQAERLADAILTLTGRRIIVMGAGA